MGVQAVGEAVALKPCGAILLGNDVGLLSGVQERPQAEGMVDMPVSVNSGMQGCLTPRPDRMVDGLRILGEARVDQEQPACGAQRVGIDQRPMQQEVCCDFLWRGRTRRWGDGLLRVGRHQRRG
jgi:hypothetical protein